MATISPGPLSRNCPRRTVAEAMATARRASNAPDPDFDWRRIAYLVQVSRALDKIEETKLVPEKKVLYQFSARGHDMAQIMLGSRLDQPKDAVCGDRKSTRLNSRH